MIIQKKKGICFPYGAKKAGLWLLWVVTVGFLGGVVNGLLGTGGGILLLFILSRAAHDKRDAFASALFCMVPLSVLSLLLSFGGEGGAQGVFSSEMLRLYLGAAGGGVLGAWLLSRISLPLLSLIFSALLLFSGARMVFA